MNPEDNKTSDPQRLPLNLTDKINLRWKDKYIASSNLRIYYTWKNIKKSYKKNKFKILALTWNEEPELPDTSYSISDIQAWGKTVNPSITIYMNEIESRIASKIKSGYYLELLTPKTMKLLEYTKSKITKN